ncbi:uncharacterized protein CANTADRAFT_24420 [Suhomyces tanzawaensis NRRL Y-17324]|uniref:Letm1 RBD domain-containing protein n=1 Tax=Suhomyces tanzawaensis NRRL Y-17324 TaxID=984487 RepID=A0A1E4SPR7_9ASCO|nr:uncharacterized protein CANTADRAFT_24420 [Suhomyces tanzawaensis NRRL Y-17324]ODV81503.1 hypothetical protein CANTADRAFT_24420 [Suhomyces tanzawaensis NRRL Y-17324]
MNGVSKPLNGLLSLSTRTNFLNDVKKNPLLSSILQEAKPSPETVNAPSTLPLNILPKQEIYDQVARENPEASSHGLKFKQSFGYAKSLMKFYKSGVTNVWNNHKLVQDLRKKGYQLQHVDRRGNEQAIRIPSFKVLTQEMSQQLYVVKTQKLATKEEGEVIKHNSTEGEKLFNLTRAQYQLMNRTPRDFYKLPMFGLIFAIFMEMTPLVCYAIPELTPLTCVLPSILPRMWNTKIVKQLLQAATRPDKQAQNAYNLPIEEVRILCKSLRISSKYLPSFVYPETYLRNQLQHYYNYLKVDNYYLSGLNGGGNVWNMTNQEVMEASLERLLIDDLAKVTKEFDAIKNEVERAEKETSYFNELRVRLAKFVVEFENFNVGYLGRESMADADIKKIMEWR